MTRRIYQVGHSTMTLEFGSITTSKSDVLVSSVDSMLTMGAGVGAAILRAGGDSIMIDGSKHIPAQPGDVVVTTAGSLSAKYVFHAITLGPGDLHPKEVVTQTTQRCLQLLDDLRLDSIAFPALGTGVAGFNFGDTAVHMAEVIVNYLKNITRSVQVTLFLYDSYHTREPMEFMRFFEEFAVRVRNLDEPAEEFLESQSQLPRATQDVPTIGDQRVQERQNMVRALGELGRERDHLERRLVEMQGGLTEAQTRAILRELENIRTQRLTVISDLEQKPENGVPAFISYAHEDERLRVALGKHLTALERQGLISVWHDGKIRAGAEWGKEISKKLDAAKIILLLISADFIDSEYCYDTEMERALERHEQRQALVIPIILRPVNLKGTPFAKLQALPTNALAVTAWPDLDSAFLDVSEGVIDALRDFLAAGAYPAP